MAEADIPVDLFNPGQVFACLGFLEAANILLGDAEGGFDWSDESNVRFRLRTADAENPFRTTILFLANAKVSSITPKCSELRTEKWNIPSIIQDYNYHFSYNKPNSPATLPAVLQDENGRMLIIDHWGDSTTRDSVKFWAGSGGYPGVALLNDAIQSLNGDFDEISRNPFIFTTKQSSSFRFDWRRDYIPLDCGFSPNSHNNMTMIGYPIVEILASIGLTNSRPERIDKLNYRYSALGIFSDSIFFDKIFLRAGLGGANLPFEKRCFRMRLGWPGQINQARCIIETYEES
ncbi:type I-G CRISPR-associated protein Cas8g2 [Desulfonatronum thiodismutans]|uniref:type I-G CRISPR-associated protein Cas8g2 n=1 Tax=Desulfonatronum thiodismutans TaxID=159290 RepID=UPI0009FC7020|nr:type I-U CRISPR-associated protein Cas8c [Desulfonatronum thiodismutans]